MACQIVTVRLKVKILTKRRHYNISMSTLLLTISTF